MALLDFIGEKLKSLVVNKNIKWFLKNKEAFTISYVAKASGIPHATLDKWTKGLRPLSEEWQATLTEWVKEFRKL